MLTRVGVVDATSPSVVKQASSPGRSLEPGTSSAWSRAQWQRVGIIGQRGSRGRARDRIRTRRLC